MPYIATEKVESSNIDSIGYHRKQQILRVIFKGGRAYDYPMVTARDFRDLMASESKGSFFNRRIKSLYAHRTPRENELVEPCCEHDGPETCTTECYPCNEWCCPGVDSASPQQIHAAITDGLAFGAAAIGVRIAAGDEEASQTGAALSADSDGDTIIDERLTMLPDSPEGEAATNDIEEEETNGSSD